MPACLICGKDAPRKICTECNERSVSSDGLANFESSIINLPLREQIRLLDKETASDPEDPALYYWKGLFQEFAGNMEEAIRSFDRANRCDVNFKWSWMRKGHILFELGRYREAIRAFQKAVELQPDDWQAYKVLGYCMQEERMFAQAIEVYNSALKIKGDEDSIHNSIGYCYSEDGEWVKAIEAYTKAQAINPNNPQTLFGLAKSYHHQGKFPEAIKVYTDAIAKGAKSAEVWVGMGEAYLNTNEYNKAIDSYEKAIIQQPNIKLKNQGKDLVGAIKDSLNIGGFGTETEQLAGKEANRLLNQALKSFTEGNYKVALQSLREVSKLSEDAKRFYESTINLIKEDVKILDRNNIEHPDIDTLLSDATVAFSKRSMTEAYTLAKIARARTTELIQPLVKQEAEDTLKNTTQLYQEMKGKAIDVGEAEDLLLKAQDNYSNQLYMETRSFGNKAYAILQGIYREYQRVQSLERIKATEVLLEAAQKDQIDVLALRKTLFDAKGSHENREYNAALEICGRIAADLENLRREKMISTIKEKITVSRTILVDVKSAGFDIEDGNAILQRASESFSEGDFEKALTESMELEKLALRKQKDLKRKLAKEAIESASSIVKMGEGEGMDLSDGKMLVQEAAEAFEIEKFDMSTELAKKAQEIMEPMVNQLLEAKAKMMFNEVATFASECQNYGIDLQKQISVMSKSQEFFAQKKFLASIQVSQQVIGMLEEVRKEYLKNQSLGKINETNTAFQEALAEYTELSLESVKSYLTQAVERFKEENYKASLELAREGRSELDRMVTEYQKQHASANVGTAKALLEEIDRVFTRAKAEGRDLSAFNERTADGRTQTDTVRDAFNQGNVAAAYKASFNLRVSIQALHDEMLRTYCVMLLKEIRELIALVAGLGADTTAAQERFKLIQEPLRNSQYEVVFRSCDELRSLIIDIKRKFLLKKAQEAYETAEKDISNAKDVSVDVADLGPRFDGAKQLTTTEKLEEAINAFGEISKDARERMGKKLLADCRQAIVDAQAVIQRVSAFGIDIAPQDQLLGQSVQLLNVLDYSGCLEQAHQAKQAALEAEKRYYRDQALAALKQAKELITSLAQQGLDMAVPQKEFEGAKPMLESEKYQEVTALALQIVRQCNVIVLRDLCAKFKAAVTSIVAYFKECSELGVDVSAPTQQLTELAKKRAEVSGLPDDKVTIPNDIEAIRGLSADAERIRADGQAKRAAFFMEKAKGLYLKVRPNLERMKAYSLDTAPVDGEVQSAVGSLKSNDPEAASKAFERALVLSEEAVKNYLRQKAMDSYEAMSTKLAAAKDEGVDPGDIPTKVEGVKPSLEKEDYETAIVQFAELAKAVDAKVQEHRKALAVKALNSAKEALLKLRSKNIDFTRANETLMAAKPAFERADYLEVVRICKETEDVCAALELEHRRNLALSNIGAIKGATEASAAIIEELSKDFNLSKDDMSKPFMDLLAEANGAFEKQDFEATFVSSQNAVAHQKTLADLLAQNRLKRDAEASIQRCEVALAPFASEGIDVTTARAFIDEGKAMYERKEYEAVIKREPELPNILAGARAYHYKQLATEAMKVSREHIKGLAQLGIGISDQQNAFVAVKAKFDAGEYETVINECKAMDQESLGMRAQFFNGRGAELMMALRTAIDNYKGEGMDVSQFEVQAQPMFEAFSALDPKDPANEEFFNKTKQDLPPLATSLEDAHKEFLKIRAREAAQKVIEAMTAAKSPFEQEGIDISNALKYLEEINGMFEAERYTEIPGRELQMQNLLEEARVAHYKAIAQRDIEHTKELLGSVKEIDLSPHWSQFNEVGQMFSEGKYQEVSTAAKDVDLHVEAALLKWRLETLKGEIEAFSGGIVAVAPSGMDVTSFESQQKGFSEAFGGLNKEDKEAVRSHFEAAIVQVREAREALKNAHADYLKQKAREKAQAIIDEMQKALDEADKAWDLSKAAAHLEETKVILAQDKFDDIPPHKDLLVKIIAVARKKYQKEQLVNRFGTLKEELKDLRAVGVEAQPFGQRLVAAKEVFMKKELDETARLLDVIASDMTQAKGNKLISDSSSAVAFLEAKVVEARASGMDLARFDGELENMKKAGEGLKPTDVGNAKQYKEMVVPTCTQLTTELATELAAFIKEKERKASEEFISSLKSQVETAKASSLDVAGALDVVKKAEDLHSKEDYKAIGALGPEFAHALELAKKKKLKADALAEIDKAKAALKSAKAAGADVSPLVKELSNTKPVFQAGKYEEALEITKRVATQSEELRVKALKAEGEKRLKDLDSRLDEASGMDIQDMRSRVTRMRESLEGAADPTPVHAEISSEHPKMVEEIDKLKNAAERDKAKAKAEEAKAYVEGRTDAVSGIGPRASGMNLSPALEMVMNAFKAAEEGKIKESADLCDEARKRADVIVRDVLLSASTKAITECQAMLEEAKVSGADTGSAEDELAQAKHAAAAEEYKNAISLADGAASALKKKVAEKEKNELIRFLERVETDIEAAKKEDLPGWKEAYALLESATDAFNNNNLEGTRTKAIEAAEALKKGRKDMNDARLGEAKGHLDMIEALIKKLGQAKGKGHYDVMFGALKDEFNDGNYKDVCEKAEILSKKIEEELEKALAQQLPEKPPAPKPEDAPKPKEDAKAEKPAQPPKAEAPKPERPAKPAEAPKAEAAKPAAAAPPKNAEAIGETIKRLEFHIAKAPPGINLSEAKELLLQAKDANEHGDPNAAIEYTKKCKESLKTVGNVVNQLKVDLKASSEKIKALKALGKDVVEIEGIYLKGKAAYFAGDYEIAKNILTEFMAKTQ